MWSSSVRGLVLPFLDCMTLECALSSQGCFVLLSQNRTRYLLGDHCRKNLMCSFLIWSSISRNKAFKDSQLLHTVSWTRSHSTLKASSLLSLRAKLRQWSGKVLGWPCLQLTGYSVFKYRLHALRVVLLCAHHSDSAPNDFSSSTIFSRVSNPAAPSVAILSKP